MGDLTHRPLAPLIEEAEEWTPLDWWKLEIRSFIVAPAVVRDLSIIAPQEAVQAEYTKITGASCLRSLSYLYAIVGPLVGAAMMIRWAWTSGDNFDLPLATAGILTALALIVGVYGQVQEHRHPRAVTAGSLRTLALLHIIPAAVSLLLAATAGRSQLTGPDVLWIVVIAADALLHVVLLVRGPVRPGGPQNEVDNIRQGLTETPQHVLDEIQDRRRSAIELLRSRDLIDAGGAARANAAPMGELGLTMAPELARHLPDAPAGAPPRHEVDG
ncbi:hypothetical protein JF550_03765 [Microbacterium esteraromaticum]|uniref:Uncharacterized protein n=1 Tax=Microbacterium esteraromaticum TaxID=57043 RepID=A0A939IUW8_9MICO|nr:hypothetical protein [Microbacterium esteraromaticum]MBN8205073.1 hypothetical protein [Microbacterium esteraromaticum]MBN8415227.1 hypothetical protein [Microbacterium esteraromaticum]